MARLNAVENRNPTVLWALFALAFPSRVSLLLCSGNDGNAPTGAAPVPPGVRSEDVPVKQRRGAGCIGGRMSA